MHPILVFVGAILGSWLLFSLIRCASMDPGILPRLENVEIPANPNEVDPRGVCMCVYDILYSSDQLTLNAASRNHDTYQAPLVRVWLSVRALVCLFFIIRSVGICFCYFDQLT